jgi:peptidoglycan-associated lipoprotein
MLCIKSPPKKGEGIMKHFLVRIVTLFFCLALVAFLGCSQKATVKDEAAGEQKVTAQAAPEAKTEAKTEMQEQAPQAQAAPEAYEFANIYFEFDKAIIKDDSKTILGKHASWLKANNAVNITVAGNCDERGTTEYNLALGQRRADAAAKYLANLGVSKKRIKTVSYGKEKPLDPGHNEEAWAKNRRDEFVIQK